MREAAMRIIPRAALIAALCSTAALAERDSFEIGDGSDGALNVTAAGTVINTYSQVTGPLAPGDLIIPVSTTAGFAETDLVMVLQTTGIVPEPASGDQAAIDLTANPVGRWELA